jgi:hypothetical protein
MAIKTTQRGGGTAGRGDQPYRDWHPSMGEPKTATGGSGKKPPTNPKTATGGGKNNDWSKYPQSQPSQGSGDYKNVYYLDHYRKSK